MDVFEPEPCLFSVCQRLIRRLVCSFRPPLVLRTLAGLDGAEGEWPVCTCPLVEATLRAGGGDRTELPREASLRGEEREVNPREGGIRGARGTGGGDRAPNPREGESPSEQGRGLDQRRQHSSSASAQSTEPLR